MADRVHPVEAPPAADKKTQESDNANGSESPQRLKPGTHVIQIPKDQIYRVPPPQNAQLCDSYRRRRLSPCCRCLGWSVLAFLAFLALLAFVLPFALAVLDLVFEPKLPSYSLDKIALKGSNFNQTTSSLEIDLIVRVENPNKKLSVLYVDGSDVSASYYGITLCRGPWPAFHQGRRNVTVFEARLRGTGVRLPGSWRNLLLDQERRREVPLEINAKVPAKIKLGGFTSWKIDVKVSWDVVVDKLMSKATIVSKKCRPRVDFWRVFL